MAMAGITSFLSMLAVVATAAIASAQTVEREFTTSTGDTLVLSPIKSMGCPEIDRMLARIDSTRYRENAPAPQNEQDTPLFEYELMLAEESYNRCVVVRKRVQGEILFMRRFRSE